MNHWTEKLYLYTPSELPQRRILSRTRNHLYLRPHPDLSGCVAHYTVTFPSLGPHNLIPESRRLTLMPDASGCFVFDIPGFAGGGLSVHGRFWGATTVTAAVSGDFDTAPVRFFIEFVPGGAHSLTGIPMRELTDRCVSVESATPALFRDIRDILLSASSPEVLFGRLDTLLLRVLRERKNGCTPFRLPDFSRIAEALSPGKLALSSGKLAAAIGYSERHLNRLCNSVLGMGIKKYAEVLRINRVLTLVRPGADLTALAHEAGYYDQSHFNHDFRSICGMNPGEYLSSMSVFYREKYKFQHIIP
ncbi:MAG: helix-turn-helix domain-containing protein [Spirochaetaceae bacterium]|nr:helix-turn-helix domain-containing protein [Spirochaetaceae bacterium]